MVVLEEQRLGKIYGIKLPNSDCQQLIFQFVDDTGLSLLGREEILHNFTSQSLKPTVCQHLSCGYYCFMGSHVNYNLSHHYNALFYNLSHHCDARS